MSKTLSFSDLELDEMFFLASDISKMCVKIDVAAFRHTGSTRSPRKIEDSSAQVYRAKNAGNRYVPDME